MDEYRRHQLFAVPDSWTETGNNPDLPSQIEALLSKLDPREREILVFRLGLDHGEPRTIPQVAKHFGLTKHRAEYIIDRAMAKLRHPVSNDPKQ